MSKIIVFLDKFNFLLFNAARTIIMETALVLMNAELGKENQIVNEIKKIPHVKEVYPVYGVYDIVMVLESDTMASLRETITTKIRKLDGIKTTLTMIIVKNKH